MSAFAALGVELHIHTALLLLPVAAIGHVAGNRAVDDCNAAIGGEPTAARGVALGEVVLDLT